VQDGSATLVRRHRVGEHELGVAREGRGELLGARAAREGEGRAGGDGGVGPGGGVGVTARGGGRVF
jgi:hypothetical protein